MKARILRTETRAVDWKADKDAAVEREKSMKRVVFQVLDTVAGEEGDVDVPIIREQALWLAANASAATIRNAVVARANALIATRAPTQEPEDIQL